MLSPSLFRKEKSVLTQDNLQNLSFSSNGQNTKQKDDTIIFNILDLDDNKIEEKEKSVNNNLEEFSFMDENEKSSTFFEISKSSPSTFFKKVPFNQIKKIIEKDNIIYKKKNNITLEHYNKRNKYLGKKTKREKIESKNNIINKCSIESKSFDYCYINNKIKKVYDSPIPYRNNKKNNFINKCIYNEDLNKHKFIKDS